MEMIQNLDESIQIDQEGYEKLISKLSGYNEKLYTDVLTGIYNRRFFEEEIKKMEDEAGIAVIDLDDFKLHNDTYGHSAGDAALITTANIIKKYIRKTDILIRYGGDEFLLILPSIKKHIFEDKLKLIREKIHDAVVPNYEKMQLSVSIGGAIFREGNMEDAVASADRQMYIAKNYKNMVVTEWDENGKKKEENSASEKLKQQILIVDDSEINREILKEILKEDALKNANLIIGAVQNDQIGPVAEFAQKNNIKYVIPFTSKNDDVLSNAYVYQVNTPHSYLYAKAAQGGCDLFAEDNIILLNIRDGKDKTEFIKAFKAEMKQRQIPFTEINYNAETLTADVDTLLRTDKRNVIVPTSGTLEALNKIKSPLRMLAETKPECGLTLFGYPEWQTYTRDCLEDFYALNTYIYSNFYADNLSKEVADFYTKYKNWYSKNLINIFPKYGILGFDTGMFFIGAINKYGSNFENNLDKIHYQGVQTGFDFHRVNNWGGFINTNIFIVHYQSDFNVTRNEVR